MQCSMSERIEDLSLDWQAHEMWDYVAQTELRDAGDARGLRYYIATRGDAFVYWIGSSAKCYECISIMECMVQCIADYKNRIRKIIGIPKA